MGIIDSGNPDRRLRLGGSNTGTNTFAGKIANGATSVVYVYNEDAGTWVLSGTNTYTGNTTVNGGTLEVVNAASLGTNTLAIAVGAKVQLDYSGTRAIGGLTIDNAIKANGVYGSSASGAPLANQDDVHFAGSGKVSIGPPEPTITTFGISGTADFSITFDSVQGFCYKLQYTELLPVPPGVWTDVSAAIPATETSMTLEDIGVTGTNPQRFYRVVLAPCP